MFQRNRKMILINISNRHKTNLANPGQVYFLAGPN